MNRFVASNGHQIFESAPGETSIVDSSGHSTLTNFSYLDSADMNALREFFRAEEDERLGRWRWPENPDYVVYPSGVAVRVLHEVSGTDTYPVYRDAIPGSQPARAGLAYFDAHPEPRPWHKARGGEVWDVDLGEGGIRAVTLDLPGGLVFRDPYGPREISPTSPDILDARRVYPEVAS